MGAPIDDNALDVVFRTARSYNGYHADPVTPADIEAIYDLLKMAPTATNQQPARFVWCLSQEAKDKLAECASGTNGEKIRKAPAAVIIAMDNDFHEELPWLFPHVDARPWFASEEGRRESAFRNSSLQGAYLLLAARALGWDSGPMSGFDADKLNAAFFADKPNVRVNFIATLGKGDDTTIFGRLPRPEFEKFNRID